MGIAMLMLWGFAVDPPLRVVAYLLLGLAVIRALPYGLGWLSRHLDLGLLLGLVLAILFGAIGRDYGLSDLFWGVSWGDQFIAGVSITALTLFLLFLGHLCDLEVEDQGGRWLGWLERRSQRPGRFGRWLAGAGVTLLGPIWRPRGQSLAARLMALLATLFFPLGLALVLVVLLHSSLLSASEGDGHRWGEWGLPLGAWATFAVAMAALGLLARAKIPARWRWWQGLLVIVVIMVAALAVALSGKQYITAATCLCLLPTLPAFFLFLTYRRSLLRVVVAAALILLVGYTNSDDTKLSLNGLEYLYDRDRMLDLKVHPSLEINPETQRLLLDLADLDMRDGKYDSAIKGLNKLIDTPEKKIKDGEKGETLGLPFQQARALFMRARAHEMVHQEQQALDDFNAMIKLHSAPAARSDQGEPTEADDLAMLIAKARLELVSLKRLSSARDDDSNKDLDEAEKELKRIKGASEQAGDKERAADASLELGLAHFLLEKYDEGIEDYKCCLEYYNAIKPADKKWQEAAAAYSGLGDVLLSQENREDAIEALKSACELDPGNALYGYKLGDALVRAKKHTDAAKVFERATRNDPKSDRAFNELGKVQWFLGRHDDAAKSFRQAAELKPESAVYNYHLGVMLATTGKPAKAIEYYRRAAEADGDKPGLAILALGAALVRANKLPEAACVFERATRNDHKNDRAFNELGKVQWSLGRYDDAAKSFRQAAKLDPKNAVYNYHLGVMLETTGWPAEAIEYYRRAAEADGDQLGLAIWAFGDALIGVRRYKEAVETFEKAVRIIRKGHPDGHPDHLRALLGLGLAHGLADDSAGAEDDLLAASRLVRQHFRSLAAGSPTDDAWVALAGDSKAAAAMARGIAEGKAGRLDEALKAFAEAEKQDPGAAAIAVFNRAVARSKAKPVDPAATADFQRAWLLYREAVRDGAGRQTRRPGRSGRVPIQGAVDNPGEAPASGRSRVRPVRYQAGETPRTGAGQDAKVPGVPIATAEQKKPEPPKPPPLHTPDPPAPTAPDKLSGGVEQTQPLVRDIKALKAWLQRWNDCGVEKPQLVVVCTSGGGIAAAYWTTLCLAELEEKVPKFPSHLRLVTGSSGGMLGAGLYVASLEAPDQPNQPKPEDRLRDLKGVWKNCDFLTPVVRQMVFRDLPSTFCTKELMPPYFKKDGDIQDRGRTLEEQWESICVGTSLKGRLSHSFAELAAGERAGWRPSLVVTPTIVELGRRLLISNLDFRSSDQGTLCNSIQFFTLFPDRAGIRRSGAQIARQKVVESLRLSTAIRMNAAFPIITPVLPLPVKSPRIRAADAGYLENYGVELAAAWIERNREWLVEETGGVTLIEIRAYTEKLKQEVERNPGRKSDGQAKAGAAEKTWWESLIAGAQGLCDPLTHPDARGLEVLTTPFETYTTARKAAMIGNNDAQVTRLQAYFAKETKDKDPPFFEKFVLICTEEAPLGWSLTPRARKRIDESLKNDELQQIIKDIADRLKP